MSFLAIELEVQCPPRLAEDLASDLDPLKALAVPKKLGDREGYCAPVVSAPCVILTALDPSARMT